MFGLLGRTGAGIDPHRKLIERAREDDIIDVKPAGADPGSAGSVQRRGRK